MHIKIKKIHANAIVPEYQSKGSAGFDLHAVTDVMIGAHARALVETGLCFEIESGYEMQIRPRSGLALKYGISVLNAPGTIDSDYRGEIKVLLINTSDKDFYIKQGDRIAQGVINRIYSAKFIEVQELGESERGSAGFGSSGIK